jgi:1-acyl-sn-glycerol-3-phosphate acyltransferase
MLLRVMMRLEVRGLEHFEVTGPCVVITNHISILDAPVMLVVLPFHAHALVAEKYRRVPVLGQLLRFIGAIFVRRDGSDRSGLRQALSVLRAGGSVGLAPEGTRSPDGRLIEAHEGAAYLAATAGVSTIPVAIDGTDGVSADLRRFRRRRVEVVVGEPFRLERLNRAKRQEMLTEHTTTMMKRLAELLPSSRRGFYA